MKALDDLKMVNRLLVAPKLAGKPLFEDGKEPIGQLRKLFQLRNRIVHPKVGNLAVAGQQGITDFTPHEAAKCLLAAAAALKRLNDARPDADMEAPSAPKLLLEQKQWLLKTSREWTDEPAEATQPTRPRPSPSCSRGRAGSGEG